MDMYGWALGQGNSAFLVASQMIIHITTNFFISSAGRIPGRQLTQASYKAGLRSKSCHHGCKRLPRIPKCRCNKSLNIGCRTALKRESTEDDVSLMMPTDVSREEWYVIKVQNM